MRPSRWKHCRCATWCADRTQTRPRNPGQFLPNGAAAKSGLNRSIHANCWGLIAQRLAHKMSAAATTLVVVPAQYSSQQCRKCGHTSPDNRESQAEFRCQACGHHDHADRNAAATILARAAQPAPTPGPGATPVSTGVLAREPRTSPNAAASRNPTTSVVGGGQEPDV
jgi:putative transposase